MSSAFKFGCQTFTWEMNKDRWVGSLPEIVQTVAAAGYKGIEISDVMLGEFGKRPKDLKALLDEHELQLIAVGFSSDTGFTQPESVAEDVEIGEYWIDFVKGIGCDCVSIGSPTNYTDIPADEAFPIAAEICSKIGALGGTRGISVGLHPSSHHQTLLPSLEEYKRIFDLMDPELVRYVPDTGHIIKGGNGVREVLETFIDRILYAHVKDVSADGSQWRMLGEGACDLSDILACLSAAPNFNGWVVVEEESDQGSADPTAAVAENYKKMIAV
ncbi:MAG: sugar phosphate isomerase/epimerase [Stappiaceae bacterium]